MSTKVARITRRRPVSGAGLVSKPALAKRLFWDVRYEDINWQGQYRTVIERVMERGNEEEWLEVIRFYGLEKVIHTLKYESTYLPDYTISKICEYFKLKQEELRCYTRKQLRKGHWI
jgi:hypothetical protein